MSFDELIEKLQSIRKDYELGNPRVAIFIGEEDFEIEEVFYDSENDQIYIGDNSFLEP